MKKQLEEQFNKLKQLDRIEYRQRDSRIREHYQGGSFFSFLNISLMVIAIMVLIILNMISLDMALAVDLTLATFLIGKILLVGLFICIVSDMVIFMLKYKYLFDLQKEYFNFKVETKK